MTTNEEEESDGAGKKTDLSMEKNSSLTTRSSRKETKEESAESASTGSSEGKSGSGGGYSADCSASDQSSDENGDRKDTDSNLNLKVAGLNLHGRAESRSSNSSDEIVEKSAQNYESESKGNVPKEASKLREKTKDQEETSTLGIDLPLKSPDTIDLESILRSKTEAERESAAALENQRILPQWNGVRIAHPMDPRIDLSSVTVLQAGVVPGTFHSMPEQQQADSTKIAEDNNASPFSVDNYSQLMEVIRPFFQSHGIVWQPAQHSIDNQQKNESGSDQVDSSEGFTSFFTTTNSGTHSGGTTNSGSPQSSDLDKKPRAVNTSKVEKESDNADASSMVVLARVKRKHKKTEDSGNSSSSGEKRVRIQDWNENQRTGELQNDAYEADPHGGSSGSSSLSNALNRGQAQQQHQQQQPAGLHISVPPRIVTDVSSKMSSATSSNVNTSTSGSGSGGNTGSGSNQGSSGSGNEGKGSSEEPAQGDNSGESPVDGSDQSFKKIGLASAQTSENETKHDEVDREKKLLDKKRKRIEMRREYEAQQQMESSESSDPTVAVVRPGKPVTMDQVLRFSKIARIVIQANPPFLVVHTNAAFARLTGIDSHQVVGQPISSLVSHHESQQSLQQSTDDGSNPQASDMSSAAQTESRHKKFELERLIATCGHGKIQVLKVLARHHHMVGRSVTITKEVIDHEKQGRSTEKEEDHPKNDGSMSSSVEGGLQRKTCKAAIAPIVSVSAFMPKASTSMERELESPKPKRRKSHSQDAEESASPGAQTKEHRSRPASPNKDHKKAPSRLVVTHYIIQLEDASSKSGNHLSMESLSSNSTSVEARLVGLSKEEYQRQKVAASEVQGDLSQGSESSTAAPEHVSALG